ncbi:MAG TPA: hypothetical protein DCE47_00920, partial [Planctomycetaceae bacterium]|nr:hypothetical protein [Planctomycetaceae bacterium]
MMVRWLLLFFVILSSGPSSAVAADGPLFEDRVYGLLKTYCWKCHGGEGRQAGLDLRSLPLIKRGGKHGPAVVAGSLEKSLLVQKLVGGQMPPGKELKPTAAHIETIKAWVVGGARARYVARDLDDAEEPALEESDRQWWAYRPPVRADLPAVAASSRVATPVDTFVLSRLEAAGLDLAAEASRTALVRRAHLDVLGLPPDP